MWLGQLPALAERHRIYLVDTIGDMNKSVATAALGTKADVVEWLDATLDARGLQGTALIGLSYGAWMATTYAIARPQRVERLVIISPAAVFSRVRVGWVARAISTHMIRPQRAKAQKFIDTTMMPATVARMPESPYRHVVEQYLVGTPGFRMAMKEAAPTVYKADQLRALTMPTLVLIGADESVCDGPASAAKARRVLPDARVELVAGSNHMMNVDQPEVLASHLTAFFG